MKRRNVIFIVLFVYGMIGTYSGTTAYGETLTQPSPIKGISDLQHVNSQVDKQKISLEGEWEFYWNQLLTPEDIRHKELQPSYIQVPASWQGQIINGEPLTNYGHATYRLQLKIPREDIGKNKALYIKYIGSAYQIWLDGQEMEGIGVVGQSREQERARLQINLVYFQPKQETVEILIHVSNHSFRESGIIDAVIYGDQEALIPFILKDLLRTIFIMGGFCVIGLYHLNLYAIGRKELSLLWIGLGGLAAAARTLLINEYLTSLLLPFIDWYLMVRLEYLVEIGGFLCVILIMKHLYPNEVHSGMIRLSYGFAVLTSGYILFTPIRVFTGTLLVQVTIMASILFYFVFYVGMIAVLRQREGARVNLIAIIILIIGMCNDTLYYTQMLDTFPLMEYGVLLFILLQGVIISYRYTRLFMKNQTLTTELVQMNLSLEEKVNVRTKALHKSNEELAHAQQTRTKMLANIAHDLGSPMVGIQVYLQLMKEGVIPIGDQEIIHELCGKSDDMKRLIDDLFELSKLESKELSFQIEQVKAKDFIHEIYRKFEPDLRRKHMGFQLGRIETMYDDSEVYIQIDPFRMMQVLQNYIGNAVKFSRLQGKTITLNGYICEKGTLTEQLSHFCLEIADEGEGISPEELPHIFQRFYKKREGNGEGSGLGLAICKEIIEQHGGFVGVESMQGQGSVFSFTVPFVVKIQSLHSDS